MIKQWLAVLILLSSITLCSAMDIPSVPREWTIHVWVNPPHSNSYLRVWVENDGNLQVMAARRSVSCGTVDCRIDKDALADIFQAARLAITQFTVDPTSTGKYWSWQSRYTWNMRIELTVGDQEISASDLRMNALTERPDFLVLLRLLNAQLPETYRIDVEETAPSDESKGKHNLPDKLRYRDRDAPCGAPLPHH